MSTDETAHTERRRSVSLKYVASKWAFSTVRNVVAVESESIKNQSSSSHPSEADAERFTSGGNTITNATVLLAVVSYLKLASTPSKWQVVSFFSSPYTNT